MAKTTKKEATVEALKQALQDATRAEAAARALATQATREPIYEVKSLLNLTVGTTVMDAHNTPQSVLWEERGVIKFLTASQILDLEDRAHLFSRGLLFCPEIVPAGPNTIPDIEQFIAALSESEVPERIAQITSPEVLSNMYHHIESKRFGVVNNEMVSIPISAKHKLVLHEVMDILGQKLNARLSTQDAD